MDSKQLPTVRSFHVTKTEKGERLGFPRAVNIEQQPIASLGPARESLLGRKELAAALFHDIRRIREGS
jgi:hypothetical protein